MCLNTFSIHLPSTRQLPLFKLPWDLSELLWMYCKPWIKYSELLIFLRKFDCWFPLTIFLLAKLRHIYVNLTILIKAPFNVKCDDCVLLDKTKWMIKSDQRLLTLVKSDIRETLNIQSNLISSFSRMSWKPKINIIIYLKRTHRQTDNGNQNISHGIWRLRHRAFVFGHVWTTHTNIDPFV